MIGKGIPGGENSLSKNTVASNCRKNSENGVQWPDLTRLEFNPVEDRKGKMHWH